MNIFSSQKMARMGDYVVKDGLHCGSKRVCKKCGKTKTYLLGF